MRTSTLFVHAILTLCCLAAPALCDEGAPAPKEPKEQEAQPKEPKEQEGEPKEEEGEPKDAKAKRLERIAEREAQRAAKREGRPLAPEAPAAKALEELLNVPPLYASDGTVRLDYGFKNLEEQGDFELKGFDAAEALVGAGRGNRARRRAAAGKGNVKQARLELAANSRTGGVLIHKLKLEGEFEVTFTVHLVRMTSRSDLVFFVGEGGVRFGTQLVKGRPGSFKPISKAPVLTEAFEGGKSVKVELTGKDGVITTRVNGVVMGTSEKLNGKLDGQVGIYARDLVIQVHQLEIEGKVDAKKMKLPSGD